MIVAVAEGRAGVTVTASDPDGLTAMQRVDVVVEAANRAPERVGAIRAEQLTEGDTIAVAVSRYFRDPDGNPLTYRATTSDDEVAGARISGATATIFARGGGSATITVSARDPEGLTASQVIRVAVEGLTVPVLLCRIDRTSGAVAGRPFSSVACELTVAYLETIETSPSVQSVTRVTEFTANQGQVGGAVVSSDYELYYWHLEDSEAETANLWRMPVSGVSRTPVTAGPSLDIDPSVAPGSTNMVFASNRNGQPSSLWLVSARGGVGLTRATQTRDEDYAPSLSPDGTWIAFERWLPGVARPDVWKLDLTTGFETQLREGQRPRVSPDGNRILYNRRNPDTGRFEIWVMDADGGGETLLSTGAGADEIQPSWSPDGSSIVYASNEGLDRMGQPNYDIWSLSFDFGTRTQLTTNGSYDDEPMWHPDGRIFFRSNRGGSWNIWYLTVEGINRAPELTDTIPGQQLSGGDTLVVDMSQYFVDPNEDLLNYAATTSDAAVATVSVFGSTLRIVALAVGNATITISARDPNGLTVTGEISVSVEDANGNPERVGLPSVVGTDRRPLKRAWARLLGYTKYDSRYYGHGLYKYGNHLTPGLTEFSP
ncbi:MAG: hypothetical protein OXE73_07785 [Gammaproteobacteria bacterium]|nr:hypothetical protein [Gammaproteobacteria bacterium]